MSTSMTEESSQEAYKFKCTFSGTVSDAMRRRGWTQTDDHDWNIFWSDCNQMREVFASGVKMIDHQKIGHFRNCQEMSRKNLLVRNLKRFRWKIEKIFGSEDACKLDFFPTTYILPSESRLFVQTEFSPPNKEDNLWIIKPAAGAQGRGIFIFKTLEDYSGWRQSFETEPEPDIPNDIILDSKFESREIPPRVESYVVQRYITNPYLIGGRKFDIRFYVLVTSFTPLIAWVYREGFARFSFGQFSLDVKALQDVYIHLTNIAIQKTSDDYNPEKGSKWSLQSLREYLTARHGFDKVQDMFNLIDVIVVRTLQSVCCAIFQDKHCFEVYGFDVLIDDGLAPWLLEVNSSPSFTPSNEEDYILKCGLIDDTASVLDVEGRLTTLEKRIGGYDLIWKDGPVYANETDCAYAKGIDNGKKLNTFLGCRNDRVHQLRELYKAAAFVRSCSKAFHGGCNLSVEGEDLKIPELKIVKDQRWTLP